MNTSPYAAYWRAVDAQDADQVNASIEAILSDLAENLASMAGRMARFLCSPLAEREDLISIMQVKVLQTLPNVPRHVTSPGGYLVSAARHGLYDYVRWMFSGARALSLDAPCGQDADGTLLDFLPDVGPVDSSNASLSPGLADALSILKPSEQVAIQDEYHFENWTPRQGQRPRPPCRRNLYRAHSHLRRLAGVV